MLLTSSQNYMATWLLSVALWALKNSNLWASVRPPTGPPARAYHPHFWHVLGMLIDLEGLKKMP